jgi:hypothetical protein
LVVALMAWVVWWAGLWVSGPRPSPGGGGGSVEVVVGGSADSDAWVLVLGVLLVGYGAVLAWCFERGGGDAGA